MNPPPNRPEFPRRAPGVELIGATDGSGLAEEQWLVMVDGSRYVQVTVRLYRLLGECDGRSSVEQIAERMSRDPDVQLSPQQVRWLLTERLAPAGLVVLGQPPSSERDAPKKDRGAGVPRTPMLAITHRLSLLPYRLTAPVTELLQKLYAPGVVVLVVAAGLSANIWLYSGPALRRGASSLLAAPELILLLFAIDVPLRLFHELGHAAAMRRAGAPYGDIGVALYVIVPVYFTDVTHSYRLSRADRVRVDLGGIYFDLLSSLSLFGVYQATGQPIFALAMVLTSLNVIREFTPFVRFDGYYLMADLIGVADPLSALIPMALDRVPFASRRAPRAPALKGAAELALAAYGLVVAAFLVRPILLLWLVGPATISRFLDLGWSLALGVAAAWRAADPEHLGAYALELAFWSMVPIGLALLSASLARAALALLKAAPRAFARWRRRHRTAGQNLGEAADVAPPAPAPVIEVETALPERPQTDATDGAHDSQAIDWIEDRAHANVHATTLEVAKLRSISDGVRRIYADVLDARTRDVQELQEQLDASRRECEMLRTTIRQLETAFLSTTAHLEDLGEECRERAESARRDWDVTIAPTRQQMFTDDGRSG